MRLLKDIKDKIINIYNGRVCLNKVDFPKIVNTIDKSVEFPCTKEIFISLEQKKYGPIVYHYLDETFDMAWGQSACNSGYVNMSSLYSINILPVDSVGFGSTYILYSYQLHNSLLDEICKGNIKDNQHISISRNRLLWELAK